MVLNLATRIFGTSNDRTLKRLRRYVEPINALEPEYEQLTDEELKAKTEEFKQRHANGESLESLLNEAFAVVREASKRTLGLRHFDVQLIGGVALHQGQIAEMKTGEGKTLVAVLAVYLNALNGKGAHIITVNDYLARRDTEWMGQLYTFLGLSVGCILADMPDDQRQQAYACDVTYGTNNEFGFDYLRDNMKFSLDEMVQREYNFAIVDEVDSILIDEARTPLIISGPSESATDLYVDVDKIIPKLGEDDYEKDEKMRTVHLSEAGVEHAEQLMRDHGILQEGGLFDAQNMSLVHHLNQALRAHKLFERDTDYIVKDNKVIIIDEFTGRMMEGRRFSEGLHQALEAKEGVDIQNENQTLASITFQNYFRLYPKLAGMTGTAMTEATEFMEIYSLGVVSVPTNEPVRRTDHDDQIYKSLQEKEDAIVATIKQAHAKNQPVLVGTVSIDKSERLSERLTRENVPHNILNARYHEREAYIIAQAGRTGMVTIATNMAGRGTDIKLGGNPEMRIDEEIDPEWDEQRKQQAIDTIWEESQREREEVVEAGGLYIVGTERHESRRIDNQLRGRSGRQGDPGESQFFLSTEDDLMRIFSPEALQTVLSNKNIGLKEGEPLTHPWLSKALERAQSRVEHQNFEMRKNLLKFDNVMNDQRKVIYEQRREIMESETVEELVTEMRHDVIRSIVANCIPEGTYPEQWDVDSLQGEVNRILNLEVDLHAWAAEEGIADQEMIDRLIKTSDARMAEKAANAGRELFRQYEKALVLQQLDQHWKEHLLNLDHLREGINLRAFGQRDPLNEYKTEAFALFENMLSSLRENITHDLSVVEINIDQDALDALIDVPDESVLHQTREDPALVSEAQQSSQGMQQSGEVEQFPVKNKPFDENDPATWSKVGRNAPCPCGSGKKFKHCHGAVK